VANDGTVDFAPELDGVLSGGGTPTLLVKGARIRVDATSLASLTFDLGFVGSFSNNATQEVVVLPGTHAFAAGDLQFFFSVTQGAAVDYDPSLDATLSGRGTNTLIVWGTAATPEDRIDALIAQVRALVTQGVLSRGRGNSLTVKLQDAKRLIAIGDIAGAIQDLRDFIAEVDAFVRARILTAAQSEPLRIRANAIIVQLQSG
jgi:hypothetical protein